LDGIQHDIGHHGVFEEWEIIVGPRSGNVVIPVGANIGKTKGLGEMVLFPFESITVRKVECIRGPIPNGIPSGVVVPIEWTASLSRVRFGHSDTLCELWLVKIFPQNNCDSAIGPKVKVGY